MREESGDGPVEAGRIRSETLEHLEDALEEADDTAVRYHVRHAIQYVKVL